MMSGGKGIVGYNVQTAVDTQHHLIVAHEVTNVGHDRHQLSNMAKQARDAMRPESLAVVADRGYFNAMKSWRVTRLASRPMCPRRRPPEPSSMDVSTTIFCL